MNIIQSNPYRILGVYSNAPKKEIIGAENKIKAYVKIGRTISFKTDFSSLLGGLERSEESLAGAVSKLTLAKDKLLYALFWFINENAFDEVAFNHLSSGNIDSAIDILRKKSTYSSYINLAVCHLIKRQWASVLYCYSKFIEESPFEGFVSTIAGDESIVSKTEMANTIVDAIETYFPEVNWLFFTKSKSITLGSDLIEIGDIFTNSILVKILQKKYIDKSCDKISAKISEADKANRKNSSQCLSSAKILSRLSSEFKILRSIVGKSDIRYTSLSDKVAEMLNSLCIGYYNNSTDFRKARVVFPFVKDALSFACSEGVKEECQKGYDFVSKRIEELPSEVIEKECQEIDNHLSNFVEHGSNSSLLSCIVSCKNILSIIKNKVGETNKEYIEQSSIVVHFALNNIIDDVNEKQKAYNDAPEFLDISELTAYKNSLEWAKPIMELLAGFAKDQKCTERFKENNDTLISLYNKHCRPVHVDRPISSPVSPRNITRPSVSNRPITPSPVYTKPSSSSNNNDNSGCIIFGIIAVVVIFIIIIASNSGSSSSSSSSAVCDTDTVAADTVVEDYSYNSYENENSYAADSVQSQNNIWLEQYKNNSLSTGATPYRSKYGGNSKSGSAGLKIKAPVDCDVLVMVKNAYGNVAKHAYIRSGQSYTFRLKAGSYQPFFIFGNSWCPEKEAPNGEMGYFLEDISISKDYPQEIGEYQELEYTLQAVQGGNFHAEYSNADEAF